MYCPYCKGELKLVDEELYFEKGKCYFSKHVSNIFKSSTVEQAKKITTGVNKKGRFFCVNCGQPMKIIDTMKEICVSCGFVIDKALYYEIIEINPHEKV